MAGSIQALKSKIKSTKKGSSQNTNQKNNSSTAPAQSNKPSQSRKPSLKSQPAATGSSSSLPISQQEYQGLCMRVREDTATGIQKPIEGFYKNAANKREQKRQIPLLLADIAVTQRELRTRAAQLEDKEVECTEEEKENELKKMYETLDAADEMVERLKQKNGELNPDVNIYLGQLKKYSINHPLNILVKQYQNMPATASQAQQDEDSLIMNLVETGASLGGTTSDLTGGSKDLAEEISKALGNAGLEDNISAVGDIMDKITGIFSLILSGYEIVMQIIKICKMNEKENSKKERLEERVALAEQLITLAQNAIGTGDSFGLFDLEKHMPVIGVVMGALNAFLQGGMTILNLTAGIQGYSKMSDTKRALEERLVRNRDKEKRLGNQSMPELETTMKRKGLFGKERYEGVSAKTARDQGQAFRQGFGTENIYKKKLELKRQRDQELKKKPSEQDVTLIGQLDRQIGQLRMAQDIERLGVTDEGKSKQTKKIRGGTTDILSVAIDLSASIAKMFPGIGDMVSAGFSIGKTVAETSISFGKWIYSMTKTYSKKQDEKSARRSHLADIIMERLDMLAEPEYAIENLIAPNAQPDRHVVKAVYKEFSALELDLQKGMGAAPEILSHATSKEDLKEHLIRAFSQEG